MNTLFLTNKYTNWYFSIIHNANKDRRVKLKKTSLDYVYYESHHIVPKSMNGNNDSSNLVLLTSREHYLCHLLLTKMCVNIGHRNKMLYAFNRFTNCTKIKNSSMYAIARLQFSKMRSAASKGKFNNFYGKTHSLETKTYLSTVCPRYGTDNGFFNKSHSPETKKQLSAIAKARPVHIPPPPMIGAANHFSKYYKITHSSGTVEIIRCLKTFVKDNDLCMHTIKIYKNKGVIPTLIFDRPYRVLNMQQKRNCEGYSIESTKSTNDPSGILPSIDHTVIG